MAEVFFNLPIAKEPEFEKCFATPQALISQAFAKHSKVKYSLISSWTEIIDKLKNPKKWVLR